MFLLFARCLFMQYMFNVLHNPNLCLLQHPNSTAVLSVQESLTALRFLSCHENNIKHFKSLLVLTMVTVVLTFVLVLIVRVCSVPVTH